MKRIGLAERTGRGIDRIYEGSLLNGRLLPDYSLSAANRVSLFIPKGPIDEGFVRLVAEAQKRLGRSLPVHCLLALNALKDLCKPASVRELTACTKTEESLSPRKPQNSSCGKPRQSGRRGSRAPILHQLVAISSVSLYR